jgi:hypothetical protein
VLQIGIQLCGSFGFFNVLTAIMSIPALDIHTSLFFSEDPVIDGAWSWTHPIVWFIVPYSLLVFMFSSWLSAGASLFF